MDGIPAATAQKTVSEWATTVCWRMPPETCFSNSCIAGRIRCWLECTSTICMEPRIRVRGRDRPQFSITLRHPRCLGLERGRWHPSAPLQVRDGRQELAGQSIFCDQCVYQVQGMIRYTRSFGEQDDGRCGLNSPHCEGDLL